MFLIVCVAVGITASVGLLVWATAPDPSQRVIRERVIAEVGGQEVQAQQSPLLRCLRSLSPLNEAPWLERMRQRAGRHLESGHVRLNAIEFLGLQEIVAAAAMSVYVMLFGSRVSWPICIAAGAAGFMVPDMLLRSHIKTRQDAVARDLPEVVDLLNLCVNAGTDFMGAVQRVVREFRPCPIVEELSLVLQEIRMGKRRRDALRGFAKRVQIPDVSSFVRTLVQADRMGTGIADALRIQSEEGRMRRFYRGEKLAQQAPVKMLIPLVLCILPTVLIIVAAPVIIQFVRGGGPQLRF